MIIRIIKVFSISKTSLLSFPCLYMQVNADLHIHSKYSGAVSEKMELKVLSIESRKKGIQLLGTGDCLHEKWLKDIKELNKINESTFELNETKFVLTTEVEDNTRVHHLIIFPSLSKVEEFIEKVKSKTPNLNLDGRPNINMNGEEIAQISKDLQCLIGSSHAFTPWTSIYASFNSLNDCYKELTSYVSFVELGLSADTNYADRISELENLTFLTNSDAHSPYPIRLAREFNRFEMQEITYEELKNAILRKQGRKPILNVGLPPEEGKYNESACIKCFKHYTLTEAIMKNWKCTCNGRIKKGVKDRVEELANYKEPKHPSHRPKYLHLIPLAEIIAKALNTTTQSKDVFAKWNELIKKFGNEVNILVDANIEEISKIANAEITNAIRCFREGKIIVYAGGGGEYGKIELPKEDTKKVEIKKRGQIRLEEY